MVAHSLRRRWLSLIHIYLFFDARGGGGVSDIGIYLHQEVTAYNHRLCFGTVSYTHLFRLDKKNAGELIRNYDIVVDGCDNFATRYLLNDVCNAWGKPYVLSLIHIW